MDHFEASVRPLLIEHCQKCHGSKKAESSLRVDSRAALLKGGDSGAAVVPGDVAGSLLIDAMNHDGLEMPPNRKLPAEQIAAIRKWIEAGAVWPDEGEAEVALGDQEHINALARDHWAFQRIEKPEFPDSAETHPIDKFVDARLRQAEQGLAPLEESRKLLRRLLHDVTGLPIVWDQVRELPAQLSDRAWREAVDDALASPHFGEHWGRHWLDLARYADTRDWFARGDLNYPYAWTYRDYVVRAMNENLPLDQFIREQLAADQLTEQENDPKRAALGFLTVGSRFRNRNDEQIADYIDVVSRGLLGLTVACARCHDHKYDPIPTADYYSLHGVFASSRIPKDFPILDKLAFDSELVKAYETEKQKRVDKFNEFLETLKREGLEDIRSRWEDYLGVYTEVESRKLSLINAARLHQLKSRATGAMFFRMFVSKGKPKWQRHPFFGPWARLTNQKKDADFIKLRDELRQADANKIHPAMLAILEDDNVKDASELTRRMAKVIQQSMSAETGEPLADVRALVQDESGPFLFTAEEMEPHPESVGSERARFDRAMKPVTDLEVTHPGAPPRAMVMVDARAKNSAVQIRGDARRRGEVVPRRFLTFVSAVSPDDESPLAKPFKRGSGRLELAEALVHRENPLTARVLVNWVWRHYFGRGIVGSADFGLRTPQPEQQLLLDYLAARLIEEDWNPRWLHQTILTSKTYRQTAEATVEQLAADPENNLFGRQTRRRLGYETMRDSMLAVCGRLDRNLYGKPVTGEAAGDMRRSLYFKVDRVDFDATRATFDFPRPDAAAVERLETTVPQQMLFALNSPFVIECAKALTSTPEFQALTNDRMRVDWLYQRVLQRRASELEQALFTGFQSVGAAEEDLPIWTWGYAPAAR
ncbi:MAG: PSD1 and planctomycete cytochrome C domain-containing protein, partial [Planctomycetota bacterium]